jgi:Sec-independent protein translocase protein TatA/RNA polymerase subunit RPABC4/transcription elongation factor Spt4
VFGISFEELIILAVLAFILFGPQKLPEYAETLGRFVAKLRRAGSEVTRQYQDSFRYPPEPAPAAPTESTCPHCQGKVGPEFTFCPNCGQRRQPEYSPPPVPEASVCPYCQEKVTADFIYCPQCGHRLKADHYSAPPPQQPLAS